MLKPLLPLLFVLFSLSAFAQQSAPIAHFASNDLILENHDAESWSVFKMEATEGNMKWIASDLKKYEREFTLEVGEKATNGFYDCKLVFSHHIDAMYLHKILKSVHVSQFTVGQDTYQLDQIVTLNR